MLSGITLRDDERAVARQRPAWTAYRVQTAVAAAGIVGGLVALTRRPVAGSAVLWLGVLLYLDTRRRRARGGTVVTTDRLVDVRVGWRSDDREVIGLDAVRDVEAVEGWFGGGLRIRTASDRTVAIDGLRSPRALAWSIMELRGDG